MAMIYPVYLLIVGNTLHVCECKSATFPWRLPPNTVGVGFAVIYKQGTTLRNIVQKKPSENHTAFYDGRITVNYSRAMTLTGVIPTDTGKYTFFTVPSDADDSDIELYVHDSHVKTFYLLKIIFNYYSKYVLIEARQLVGEPHIQQYLFLFTDCPLEEDITAFKVLVQEVLTGKHLQPYVNESTNQRTVRVQVSTKLEVSVRMPPAKPPVECSITTSRLNHTAIGGASDITVCSMVYNYSSEENVHVTVALKYSSVYRGIREFNISGEHRGEIFTLKLCIQ